MITEEFDVAMRQSLVDDARRAATPERELQIPAAQQLGLP